MVKSNKNLALIGFMGCGKSVIGRALANKMNYSFIDCDIEIQKRANMTIPHIFEKYGEDYFRELEKNFISSLAATEESVISTGGGVIKSNANIDNLKKNSILIYLKAGPQKLYKNTIHDDNRPLLDTPDRLGRIKELLQQREPLYTRNADIIININALEINEAADEIIKIIESRGI